MPSRKKLKGNQKQRNTRKIRKTRKSKKYSFDKYYGGLAKDKNAIVKYLHNLKFSVDDRNKDDKKECTKPGSKSGQIIEICTENKENEQVVTVYKSPPLKTVPIVTLRQEGRSRFFRSKPSNVCYVDSFTMNLLIQSIICEMDETYKEKIEHYDKLFKLEEPNYYFKTLVGKGYKYECDGKRCFSVEDYIKELINDSRRRNQNIEAKLNVIKGWIKIMISTLNYLWNNIQFHHCDPKAAQLFISGKCGEGKLIVGDLDKITFSLNIQNKDGGFEPYRVCSYGVVSSKLVSFTKSVKRSKGGGLNIIPNLSFAEKMRSNYKPNQHNYYEIAAFISSILVLINDNNTRTKLYNIIKDDPEIIRYINLIDWLKLQQNNDSFDKKTSHKVACKYVIVNYDKGFNNKELKSNCNISFDGHLKNTFTEDDTVPIETTDDTVPIEAIINQIKAILMKSQQ